MKFNEALNLMYFGQVKDDREVYRRKSRSGSGTAS